jgi:4-hydroxy-2-oxoheptanedioate aldolase
MLHNRLKEKLAAGETVYGVFSGYAEAGLAEFTAMLGWDFLVFDGEHGQIDSSDLAGLARACELRQTTPLARVTTNQPHLVLRYLDAGVHGLHVPWVNTAEGVEAAVQAAKYAPRGIRGLAGSRASDWGMHEPVADYVERANRETMVIIHIETRQAAEAIDDYLAVDGVDVLFLGPSDMSQSLGHPGEVDHPEVTDVMERVAEAVAASTKTLGIYASTPRFAMHWRDRGARYIATGFEGFIRRGSAAFLDALRT